MSRTPSGRTKNSGPYIGTETTHNSPSASAGGHFGGQAVTQADKQHWTVGKALAAHVGIPRTTLQSAVTQGRIPSRTFGCGSLVVNIRDVRAWAKSHEPRASK